ncbi:MAG: serine/threonine protein kinase [Bryobacteraceae bacterium]|nr:serine/threonine protein kinase [Bryobacteraceae bacterium]
MTIPDPVLDHLCEVLDLPDLAATRYELGSLIGRGGMGSVYLARDRQLDRQIALKVIDVPPEEGQPLLAEARVLARLEHPGIVTVHDAGELPDGRAFLAMRLVDGVRLDVFLGSAPALSERLAIFGKLSDAVNFAHSKGVVHCDLKPENIMIGAFGEVVVLDWGIALRTAGDRARSAVIAGTSQYMSPEQAEGIQIDHRSDIFALGVIFGQCLPHPAPRPLTAIAAKARSREPENRYAQVGDMVTEIRRYQDRLPVDAYPEPVWERTLRFAERNRVLLLLLATYVSVRVILFFLRPG